MSLINVQLDRNGPITQIDDAFLVRTEGVDENDNERAEWVEYRLRTEPDAVRAPHRSVHLTLKKAGVVVQMIAGNAAGGPVVS